MKHSGFLFVLFVLCLLLFQGWLAKYHGAEFAELPPERAERAGFGVAARAKAGGQLGGQLGEPFWECTWWIPKVLDRKLYQLSVVRLNATLTGGNTLIDGTVQFKSAKDFPGYLPRAVQVGLLSPSPEFWSGAGSMPAMTLARKIAGAATCIFYVCLAGFLFGLFSFRENMGLRIVFVFCLLGILVYAFAYPNIGTLMRYRYGFYMMLVSFGAAVIAEQVFNWRGRKCLNG